MASKSIVRAQVRKRASTPAICPHHPGNIAVFVCTRPGCDGSFTCMKCVTTNHKGHEMEDLADYADAKKQILKTKIKSAKQDMLNFLLQNIKSTEEKIIENKTKTRDDQDKILQRCNELKTELDKICQKYTELRKKTGDKNDRKLTKHKECLETMYTQYKTEMDECETAVEEGSDADIVLAENELPTSPKPPNLPILDDLQFRFKTISNNQLDEWFGELFSMKDTGFTLPTAVPLVEQYTTVLPSQNIRQMIQFVLNRNTIFGCSYVYPSSDQLYVWFHKSRTISLVNKHGKVSQIVTLQPGLDESKNIRSVCISPVDGTLWSVCNDGLVQQIKQDGTLLQNFTQKYAMSVCITHNQSVLVGVAVSNDVNIVTTSGKLTRTLTKWNMELSSCPYYIVQCQKTGRVAISDFKAVSVLDEEYRRLYTLHGETVRTAQNNTKSTGYKPKEEFYPFRMCFDRDGDLLVSDTTNFSVILFSSSGEYIRTIIQETEEDKRPRTINTAPDGTLWVANENDVFKQIKYK